MTAMKNFKNYCACCDIHFDKWSNFKKHLKRWHLPVICKHCGNEYIKSRSDYQGRGNQSFCSEKCKKDSTSKRRKATYKRWMKEKPTFAINRRIKPALAHALKKQKISKTSKTYEILGYDSEELISHLEAQFVEGMNWEDSHLWHIDHIIPLNAFNYDSVDHPEFKVCWSLGNLRPIWAKDNMRKNDKWVGNI